jgi:hypothetical protein
VPAEALTWVGLVLVELEGLAMSGELLGLCTSIPAQGSGFGVMSLQRRRRRRRVFRRLVVAPVVCVGGMDLRIVPRACADANVLGR